MLTQWTVGASGVIGLRYEALPFVFCMHGIDAPRQREAFNAVRILENEAVRCLNTVR